jgi:hypothetical protein
MFFSFVVCKTGGPNSGILVLGGSFYQLQTNYCTYIHPVLFLVPKPTSSTKLQNNPSGLVLINNYVFHPSILFNENDVSIEAENRPAERGGIFSKQHVLLCNSDIYSFTQM